jgi:hypothetical protein
MKQAENYEKVGDSALIRAEPEALQNVRAIEKLAAGLHESNRDAGQRLRIG